eukprot:scaffold463491_cov41-Prasinocladus_malaysianus.AAC.2
MDGSFDTKLKLWPAVSWEQRVAVALRLSALETSSYTRHQIPLAHIFCQHTFLKGSLSHHPMQKMVYERPEMSGWPSSGKHVSVIEEGNATPGVLIDNTQYQR